MIDLKAIRERCNKATKGPWITFSTKIGSFKGQRCICEMVDGSDTDAKAIDLLSSPNAEQAIIDRDFIAHSRSDMEQLLEAVEELEMIVKPYDMEDGDWICDLHCIERHPKDRSKWCVNCQATSYFARFK